MSSKHFVDEEEYFYEEENNDELKNLIQANNFKCRQICLYAFRHKNKKTLEYLIKMDIIENKCISLNEITNALQNRDDININRIYQLIINHCISKILIKNNEIKNLSKINEEFFICNKDLNKIISNMKIQIKQHSNILNKSTESKNIIIDNLQNKIITHNNELYEMNEINNNVIKINNNLDCENKLLKIEIEKLNLSNKKLNKNAIESDTAFNNLLKKKRKFNE
jgi:hypothetical protein